MTNQRGYRHFGEPEIIGDAREAVAQDMRRDIRKRRLSEKLLPMIGEATKAVVGSISWKDIGSELLRPSRLQELHHGKPDRPN
jgi:hypothetical protein